ncbi:hypothetical protein [Burkholderia cenocepacia]|uniref:hypothetical protein n=1 Tax=Burkholderia cenocepacia TaxID=95486 RepID=UPI002AB2192B|nr:hypothetical protein [Burkholderia cenocepacia]
MNEDIQIESAPHDPVCAWMCSELLHGVPDLPESLRSLPKLVRLERSKPQPRGVNPLKVKRNLSMLEDLDDGMTKRQVAEKFEVTISTVNNVFNNRHVWEALEDEI